MRKKLIAGNWKMNKTIQDAEDFLNEFALLLEKGRPKNTDIVICPPAPYLEMVNDYAREFEFGTGAQNVYKLDYGAVTGEISAPMLKSMDIKYVIIGHSERRNFFGELDEMLFEKIKMCLKNDILPIYCCGELLPEREEGKHFDIVKSQIETALFKLSKDEISRVIIAYEPVWAIGTGKTATPEQAQEMHEYIRSLVEKKFKKKIAEDIIILYGGSCNAKNAKDIFSQKDVDGGLIGGASLKADEFYNIIKSSKIK